MTGTYSIFPLACTINKFYFTDLKVNGYSNTAGVHNSASCANSNYCGTLDLDWNDFPHNITYIYRLDLVNGQKIDTPVITILLQCKV